MLKKKSSRKRLAAALVSVFIVMNVVAFFHAYKFTHFSHDVVKTRNPEKLSAIDKVKTLLLGVNNPRPVNREKPKQAYTTVILQSNKKIACWCIATGSDTARGTVIIFHGYSGDKSSMLNKSDEFLKLGYNTVLVDFMGSGESEGNVTTVGYAEAEEVKTVYDYVHTKGEKNIYLFGTSMGAVAIMKAMNDYQLSPNGIILECPFGSMYETVCARFRNMHAPCFPMAGLLVLWGGAQGGFWAFGHNPTGYARNIRCNTLLIWGEDDKNVSRNETNEIFANLAGPKTLEKIAYAGHEDFLLRHREQWLRSVVKFLQPH